MIFLPLLWFPLSLRCWGPVADGSARAELSTMSNEPCSPTRPVLGFCLFCFIVLTVLVWMSTAVLCPSCPIVGGISMLSLHLICIWSAYKFYSSSVLVSFWVSDRTLGGNNTKKRVLSCLMLLREFNPSWRVTECTVVAINTVVNLEAGIVAGTRDRYGLQRPIPMMHFFLLGPPPEGCIFPSTLHSNAENRKQAFNKWTCEGCYGFKL